MILRNLVQKRATYQQAVTTLHEPAGWLAEWFGGRETKSGVSVDTRTALQSSPFYASATLSGGVVGSLPWELYARENGGRRKARELPLYDVLHSEANPEMSSFTWRETTIGHLFTDRNAYSRIERNRMGDVVALWLLQPEKVTVKRRAGELVYEVTPDGGGKAETLPDREVLHIRGFGRDGLAGLSLVWLAMESIGLSLATERFGAEFFGGGSRLSMALEHPGRLSEGARKNIIESLEARHAGRPHGIDVFEEGMKAREVSAKNEESQFLETREHQVEEAARWNNMPPHMIQDLRRATFSNIEHSSLNYVIYHLTPVNARIEQEVDRKCLRREQRRMFYNELNVDGLLRGDVAARSQFYKDMFGIGVYSQNDILELQNRNPVEGGDRRYVALNMVPVDRIDDQLDAGKRSPRTGDQPLARMTSTAAYHRLVRQAVERILRREIKAVRSAVGKLGDNVPAIAAWIEEYYGPFEETVKRDLGPVVRSTAELAGALDAGDEARAGRLLGTFAARYVAASKSGLLAVLKRSKKGQTQAAVCDLLDEWEKDRADTIAADEIESAIGDDHGTE